MQRKFAMRFISLLGLLTLLSVSSCKDDDTVTCVTCSNDQTLDFTLCREANGDASVNGEDTNQDYNVYLANLQEQEGTSCN